MTWTIRELLAWTTQYFASLKISSPRLDAEILLAHSLKLERLQLYLDADRPVTEPERSRFRELIRKRAGRIPVAYLTGTREFWSLPVRVTRAVMIPRPETESLVRVVLEAHAGESRNIAVCDMGTGSGCITMALAGELAEAVFWCSDISRDALAVARSNFRSLGILHRTHLEHGDWFQPMDTLRDPVRFDVICSNPPYIPSRDLLYNVEPEIGRYEPNIALDGGADGLKYYPVLAEGAMKYLNEGGMIAVEIGNGQADDVMGIFKESGLVRERVVQDDFHTDRIVVGCKP
ncbi:peptide chain release factor N(5)-glutamine methyltransferase [bacterium]|nr:peptide chain release factor N(5)-glutamine methyltransferase [candidate division CSSED10-310 bacterium]